MVWHVTPPHSALCQNIIIIGHGMFHGTYYNESVLKTSLVQLVKLVLLRPLNSKAMLVVIIFSVFSMVND